MSIVNGYCTLAEIKARLDITDASQDTPLEQRVESASRQIDQMTNDFFYSLAAATFYLSADDGGCIATPSLQSVTTLKTDYDGDGTFETTWAGSDYVLEPRNNPNFGRPYTEIRRALFGTQWFPSGIERVQVVGTFGWATVPDAINEACLLLATRYFRRTTLPFGLAGTPELGPLTDLPLVDADVKALVFPFRRFLAVPV